jgi:hypothetical protein
VNRAVVSGNGGDRPFFMERLSVHFETIRARGAAIFAHDERLQGR